MRFPIHVLGEYSDDSGLDHCEVTIDEELARRIKLLATTIKKVKATYIEEFMGVDEYYTCDDEVWDGQTDCEVLRVGAEGFYWTGYFNNTSIEWETEMIPMKVVDEILMVADTPREKLPLLLRDSLSEDAKRVLEKKLKG